jgi:hypothetical protein
MSQAAHLNQSFARARWAGNPPHRHHIQAVRPGTEVFKVSAKTGEGMKAGAFVLAPLARSESE